MLYQLLTGVPTFGLGDEVDVRGEHTKGSGYVVALCKDPNHDKLPLDPKWKKDEAFPQIIVQMKVDKKRVHLNGSDLKSGKLMLTKKAKPKGPTKEEVKRDLTKAIRSSKDVMDDSVKIESKLELECFNELAHRIFFCGVDTHLFLFEGDIYRIVLTNYEGRYYFEHCREFPEEGIGVALQ